jgi:mannose-6-phosphate isomerase-like protein (cupin superfamily)
MGTAIIDESTTTETTAWWFLDLLAIEHRCAPGTDTVVLETTLPLGSSPPLHIHEELDDTWFIIEGQMVVRCGDEESHVAAGDWVSLPRGVPHSFVVVGDGDARILMVHDNPSFRDFVRDVGVPAEERVVPAAPVFPPLDDLARIAASHDMAIVGPPMSVG